MKKRVFLALFICGIGFLHAEETKINSDSESLFGLQEVTVQADSLTNERHRLSNVAAGAGIKREQIEQRPNRRIGDSLKRLPGVFMGGPPSENNDIRLRGLDKEFTRVQVNGAVIPDGGEKRELQLNRIPSTLIEQATILRNPTSEYESDGLAGRVELKTRPIPHQFGGDLRVGYGGRDRFNGTLLNSVVTVGGRPLGWFGMMGTFSLNYDALNKNKTENEFLVLGNQKIQKTEGETKRLTASDAFFDVGFFYEHGEVHIKPLLLQLKEDRTKTLNSKDFTKPVASDDTQEKEAEYKIKATVGTSIEHLHRLSNGVTFENLASVYSTEEEKGDKTKDTFKESGGLLKFDAREVESENKRDLTWNYGNKVTLPFVLAVPQSVKTGFSTRFRDRFRNKTKIETKASGVITNKTVPKDTYFLTENYFAGFVQDEFKLHDRFTLQPGVRIEHVNLSAATTAQAEVKKSITDVNPSAHALWRVTDHISFKSAISRVVNRPKFDELSPFEQEEATKIKIGNPNLDPARSWNLDVGMDSSHQDLFLGINAFYKWVTGIIEEVDTGVRRSGKSVFQFKNVGDGWVRGLELEQRIGFNWTGLSLLRGLNLWSNQTGLESLLREASGIERRFKEQPEWIVNAGLDYEWQPQRVFLSFSAGHVGRRSSQEASGDAKQFSAEWTFDSAARYRLHNGLYLFVEFENMTNEPRVEFTRKSNGETVSKTETGGRTVLAGVTHRF